MEAQRYFDLSRDQKLEFLIETENATGIPRSMVEKDIWEVWFLKFVFEVFKHPAWVFHGGTCLSKVFDIIFRMSEDIDLTHSILDSTKGRRKDDTAVLPATRSQAKLWRKDADAAIQAAIAAMVQAFSSYAVECGVKVSLVPDPPSQSQTSSLKVHYDYVTRVPRGMLQHLKVEINGSGTGLPNELGNVKCYAQAPSGLLLPTARVKALRPEVIFWGKVLAISQYCWHFPRVPVRPRDLYDAHCILNSQYGPAALDSYEIGLELAQSRDMFYHTPGFSCEDMIRGKLRLVPVERRTMNGFSSAYQDFVNTGMIWQNPIPLDTLLDSAAVLEKQLNDIAKQH